MAAHAAAAVGGHLDRRSLAGVAFFDPARATVREQRNHGMETHRPTGARARGSARLPQKPVAPNVKYAAAPLAASFNISAKASAA